MSVEYLLVSFPEDCDVLADGDRVGVTNHTILISANEYVITLGGAGSYATEGLDVVVSGTSIMRPKIVVYPHASGAVAAGDGGADAHLMPIRAGLPQPAAQARRRKSIAAKPG